MLPEKKYCKACAEEIHGRKDKLYCSDYCRVSFYNHLNTYRYGHIRNTNSILRRNWKVLADCNQQENTILTEQQLIEKGFSFDYYTRVQSTPQGQVHFCYDEGYMRIAEGKYILIKGHQEVTIKPKRQPRVFLLNRYQPA